MRARVVDAGGRRKDPWKRFRPGRWYPAEWVDAEATAVRLSDGANAAVLPRDAVEIRNAPDDAWELRTASRMSQSREGQTLDYPARVAECPEGHARAIPTRFDSPPATLKCAECGRAYRLPPGA